MTKSEGLEKVDKNTGQFDQNFARMSPVLILKRSWELLREKKQTRRALSNDPSPVITAAPISLSGTGEVGEKIGENTADAFP